MFVCLCVCVYVSVCVCVCVYVCVCVCVYFLPLTEFDVRICSTASITSSLCLAIHLGKSPPELTNLSLRQGGRLPSSYILSQKTGPSVSLLIYYQYVCVCLCLYNLPWILDPDLSYLLDLLFGIPFSSSHHVIIVI